MAFYRCGGGSTLKKVTSVMDINSWDISGSDYDTG